uniref:Uncharacterized protein n=1 Tax=Zea mays TaxID=4577 RepID=C0HI79_MAIZE|nr:unknown [Zea mays]
MGSRNGNVVRGTLQKVGFNTTGTRLFPRSRNEERGQVPSSRLFPERGTWPSSQFPVTKSFGPKHVVTVHSLYT